MKTTTGLEHATERPLTALRAHSRCLEFGKKSKWTGILHMPSPIAHLRRVSCEWYTQPCRRATAVSKRIVSDVAREAPVRSNISPVRVSTGHLYTASDINQSTLCWTVAVNRIACWAWRTEASAEVEVTCCRWLMTRNAANSAIWVRKYLEAVSFSQHGQPYIVTEGTYGCCGSDAYRTDFWRFPILDMNRKILVDLGLSLC